MVEKEAVKEKEAELKFNYYEDALNRWKATRDKARQGKKIIKGKEIPWQVGRQGIIGYYHTEPLQGHAMENLRMFVHEIRTHSGRHVHQGGFNLFVLKGKGYTVVDGKRFDWSAGDLILLPFKKGGVEHQHFNVDNRPSKWLAFSSIPVGEMVGFFMEQKENYEGFKG